ncbi:MAG: hypothetical protein AABZ58_07670 [Chloroflexota bacterium]
MNISEERFKKTIAVLIAVVTTLIAIVTYLQSDAGARDDAANRDTKRYSLESFGRQVSGDACVNFDYNSAYQAYYELDLLAVSAANAGDEAAAISPFTFAEPLYDEQGNFTDYAVADTFEYGASAVAVLFDYDHMQDGQDVVFKVYVDGEEDPSWRLIDKWVLGTSGGAEKPLSFDYSYANVLRPGFYTVEMYVDSHLGQSGSFVIGDP